MYIYLCIYIYIYQLYCVGDKKRKSQENVQLVRDKISTLAAAPKGGERCVLVSCYLVLCPLYHYFKFLYNFINIYIE